MTYSEFVSYYISRGFSEKEAYRLASSVFSAGETPFSSPSGKQFSIAIDGPAAAGKSTMARKLAEAFGFIYVDTGAIYRAVGLASYRRGLKQDDEAALAAILPDLDIRIGFSHEGKQLMYLNGEDVTSDIRKPGIAFRASCVSAMPSVRKFLLDMQRDMAREYDVVMDGRDIGTVVLPHADIKFYLTASLEVRGCRRYLEDKAKGMECFYLDECRSLQERDTQDMSRAIAPLKPAEVSWYVDNSKLNIDETFRIMSNIIQDTLGITPVKN